MTAQHRPVVIGVDGSSGNHAALRYGLAEARRLDASVRLVHVAPDYVPISPMMPLTPGDLAETGTAILKAARAAAHDLAPDIQVEGWLHHGARGAELARAAEHADLLVVGRDDRPLLERLVLGNTATGAAARSAVPSVTVPADWQPTAHGVVLVGVKSSSHSDALLGDAFAVAADHGSKLVVLHAWSLPSEYDDIIQGRGAAGEWAARSTRELETMLREWRAAYPAVEVEVRVVHDYPVHALVAASEDADVLVLVRRAHGVPTAAHLGGTARSVLRWAHCPVRVVPPQAGDRVPGLVFERAGGILK